MEESLDSPRLTIKIRSMLSVAKGFADAFSRLGLKSCAEVVARYRGKETSTRTKFPSYSVPPRVQSCFCAHRASTDALANNTVVSFANTLHSDARLRSALDARTLW